MAVGYLLYYGRSVDSQILPATCALASEKAARTLDTMHRLYRLLGYVAAHLNGQKIYRASDMVLRVLTDASYLSRPKAGSVAGSFHFLGMHEPTPVFINHPVSATQPTFWSSARSAARLNREAPMPQLESPRKNAAFLPTQPPTPWYCDNEYAVGLASDTITPKMSKSMDMRFHCLRDRVRQGQFVIKYVPGLQNIADFFTKALPVARHKLLAPYVALDDSDRLDDLLQAKLK